MSSTPADTRIGRPEAVAVARAFVAEIEDCCGELRVAGSLRRRLARISDVEIVAVPGSSAWGAACSATKSARATCSTHD